MEIRKLNTLRGLAALIVFVTHFSDATNWLGGSLGGAAGQYGVMLFFLLSGFLMSYLYFDKVFDKGNMQKYLLARLGRVLPLYLVIVLSSYFASFVGLQGLYEITDINTLVAHLMFVYGESVLWTISPEMQFYLFFLVFWFLADSRAGYIYVLIAAILILLFFTNFPRIYGDINGIKYNFFNVLRSLPYFFIGVIFGMHYRTFKVPEYLKKNWFIFVLLLIPLMYPDFSPVISDAKNKMWLSYEVLFVMSCVFFCIVYLVPDDNVLLANRVGDFLGKISYSLYLLHMPIIAKVNELSLSVGFKLLLSLILCLVVAFLSYRYFEKPMAMLVKKLRFS